MSDKPRGKRKSTNSAEMKTITSLPRASGDRSEERRLREQIIVQALPKLTDTELEFLLRTLERFTSTSQ